MSVELRIALVTYVVPALITGMLYLRQRRLSAKVAGEKVRAAIRVSDWEASQELRDEYRADNADLRRRLSIVEARVDVLTELLIRHGVPIPEWPQEREA
jgi:predicted nucleotidyltransferase